ncbi:hypothetical protein [Microcoleus asticus]|nr:hypothetical protein [Microcoleus asticus]
MLRNCWKAKEGRRKKEEGRRKEEEGRGKKEEGRRKKQCTGRNCSKKEEK